MSLSSSIATLLLLSVASSLAAEQTLEYPKPSFFDRKSLSRNPFERIDAKNMAEAKPVESALRSDAAGGLVSLFRVTAISIDRLSIAVINQRAFAEKDVFQMRAADKWLKVRVVKVNDGFVTLDCSGTVIEVPVVQKLTKLLEE